MTGEKAPPPVVSATLKEVCHGDTTTHSSALLGLHHLMARASDTGKAEIPAHAGRRTDESCAKPLKARWAVHRSCSRAFFFREARPSHSAYVISPRCPSA